MHPLKGSTWLTPDRAQDCPVFILLCWPCGHFSVSQRYQGAALLGFGPRIFPLAVEKLERDQKEKNDVTAPPKKKKNSHINDI